MPSVIPILLGLFSAVAVFVLVRLVQRSAEQNQHRVAREKTMQAYGSNLAVQKHDESSDGSAIGAAIDRYRKNLQQQLNTAGIEINVINWMGIQVLVTVVGFAALTFRISNPILAFVISAAIAFFGTKLVVGFRTDKRVAEFEAALPQILQLLASGIRSGLVFDQALESASAQDRGEVGKQFRQAFTESTLDGDLEGALLRVSVRMRNDDLKWLVSALQIQREIGGSLSSILENVAETIRARADIRREVRVLSAEGKLSGYVLIALPFVVLLALMVIRPSYVTFFWTDPTGIAMAFLFLVLVTVGWLWLQRIVKVKA